MNDELAYNVHRLIAVARKAQIQLGAGHPVSTELESAINLADRALDEQLQRLMKDDQQREFIRALAHQRRSA